MKANDGADHPMQRREVVAGVTGRHGRRSTRAKRFLRYSWFPNVPAAMFNPPRFLMIERYTRTAIALHWIIALLIIGNAALALVADDLPEDWVRPVIDTHKSIGITVLGLAIMRVLWRLTHRAPTLPVDYPRWERLSAHAVHGLLYLLIFALPLSGWLHDSAWKDAATHPMRLFGLVPWPRIGWVMDVAPATKEQLHDRFGLLHTWFGYVLYGAFGLHVLGALKHQFVDREPELQRMLPEGRR